MATPLESAAERVDFVYKLDGADDGVDVFTLAPTLLHLGQLITESNNILNPSYQRVGVNVRPFKPGSFIVETSVFQQLQDMPQGAMATAALVTIHEILKDLGLIKGIATSVRDLMKWSKGKTPSAEKVSPNEIRYSIGETSITATPKVHALFSNQSVTQNIHLVFTKPMDSSGVTAIRGYLKGQQADTEVVVSREESASLLAPATVEAAAETVGDSSSVVFLNPRRGSFEGAGDHWSFRRGDAVIPATIRDAEFLDLLRRGIVRPHHTDLLKVELREVQSLKGTQVSSKFEIIKVLEYQQGAKQMDLPGV